MTRNSSHSLSTTGPQLHRRRQRVVVRSPDPKRRRIGWRPLPAEVDCNRRNRMPTLPGLGEEPERDTLPDVGVGIWVLGECSDTVGPIPKPATLLDGVDDELARAYQAEAERIVASGVFSLDVDDEQEPGRVDCHVELESA